MDTDTYVFIALLAVGITCWLLQNRSAWFVLGSAVVCILAAAYFFYLKLWGFAAVQVFWSAVGLWIYRKRLINAPQS